MDKRKTYRTVLAIFLTLSVIGCTKSETRTKRLLKQGRWTFTQLKLGSSDVTLLPKWDVEVEPEDKAFAPATWTHYDGSTCQFLWRFDYYEGTFSFKIDLSISQDDSKKAYIQCYNLSGSYFILTDKSNLFEFESYETMGYPGMRVFIQMQPL